MVSGTSTNFIFWISTEIFRNDSNCDQGSTAGMQTSRSFHMSQINTWHTDGGKSDANTKSNKSQRESVMAVTRARETRSQWDAKVSDSWCVCNNMSAPRCARVLVQIPSLFCRGRVVRERTSKSKFSESPWMWSQVLMQTLWLRGRESETNSGWRAAPRSETPPVFIIPAWDVQVGISM